MKKKGFLSIIAVVAALVTSLSFPLTAAAVSRTTATEVLGVSRSLEDASNPQVLGARRNSANGDNVTTGPITDKDALAALSDLELFAKLISEYTHKVVKASELTIIDSMDVKASATTIVSDAMPLYVSFSFPSITETTSVYVIHFYNGEWKIVPETVSEGYVTGKFTSLSPVAIVAKTNTLKGSVKGASRKKSPRTGDYSFIILSGSIAALGLVGIAYKKKQFS